MQSSETNYYHQQQLFGISEQLKQQIKHGEVLKIPLVYHYGVSVGFLLFFRKITNKNQGDIIKLAASPGLEPRLTESESAVLPLDDEAIHFFNKQSNKSIFITCQILLLKKSSHL